MELLELGRKAAGVDPVLVGDDELMGDAVALEATRSMVELASAKVLAALELRGCTDAAHGSRTAPWVAAETGASPRSVRSRLRAGHRLSTLLNDVSEAVADGRLSFDHARLLCEVTNSRVRYRVAELQEEIIALAAGATFEQWSHDVRCLIALLDADGPEPDDETRNRMSWTETMDGVTHVQATLSADLGLLLITVIDQAADALYRRYTADHEVCPEITIPPRPTLRALALGELLRAAQAALGDPDAAPTRAEVTLILHGHCQPEPASEVGEQPDPVDADPNGPTDDRVPAEPSVRDRRPGRIRPAPHLRLPPPVAPPSNANLGRTITDHRGRPVPASAAAMWACDPDLWAVVVDHLGLPLDVGHTRRLATTAQRRAVAARDGGCVFPGCDAPTAWTDAHHLQHWANGGPTAVECLCLLCRHHHTVIHRPGWTIHLSPDGHLNPEGRTWIRTPAGRRLWGQQHHRTPSGTDAPPRACPGCPGCNN